MGEEGKGVSGTRTPKGLVVHVGIWNLILSIAGAIAGWEQGKGVI